MVERGKLDLPALENWLWDAACQVRGPVDAPKFKDYILPLVFIKRLSDVFNDELERLAQEFGDLDFACDFAKHQRGAVRCYVSERAHWSVIRQTRVGLGQHLTDAVRALARENPEFQGVIDMVDFNATAAGQRIVDDSRLAALVEVLSQHRLGLDDVEPDVLGRAYEYLLRTFAEGQGQSAGEFYTSRQVGVLMARLLDLQPGMEVYDPACGSAGLLIKCHLRLLETHGVPSNGRRKLPDDIPPPDPLRAGDQPGHLRHRPDERHRPRRAGAGRPRRHHAPAGLHRCRGAAAPVRPGDREPHVEPGLPGRGVRARFLRALQPRHPASLQRRLGLAAARARLAQGQRAHGGCTRHRRGQPGQRQHRLEPGAGYPPGRVSCVSPDART